MLPGKTFLIVLFIVFCLVKISAQISQSPQQIKILNNYGEIPFEDGKTVISEIKFLGLDDSNINLVNQLFESHILRELKETRSSINIGEKFRGYKVSKAVKSIRKLLASEGYIKAEVGAFGEKLSSNEMKLTFVVKRGSLAWVSEIRFEGNKSVSNAELVAAAKKCIGTGWKIFDARKYEYIVYKCSLGLVRSKGYLKAQIGNIIPQQINDTYTIIIQVDEGNRYRLGNINVEGLNIISREKFLEVIGQKTGEIVNGIQLRNALYETLGTFYKNNGYILYEADMEFEYINPKNEGEDGIVNLKIIVDEGRQFKIRKIEIVHPELLKIQKIRKLLGIVEGEIYSEEKLKTGFKRINDTKDFRFADYQKDVELRTDEESADIYLVVKIDRK